jgi:transposase-like protein
MGHPQLERETMTRTRMIDPSKEAFWRGEMDRQADSGLSIAAWCRQNQIASSLFHHWRRTLRRRGERGQAPNARPAMAAPKFIPLLVASAPADPAPSASNSQEAGFIEIILGGCPCRVRVRPGFDAPTLARVLDVLEPRSC